MFAFKVGWEFNIYLKWCQYKQPCSSLIVFHLLAAAKLWKFWKQHCCVQPQIQLLATHLCLAWALKSEWLSMLCCCDLCDLYSYSPWACGWWWNLTQNLPSALTFPVQIVTNVEFFFFSLFHMSKTTCSVWYMRSIFIESLRQVWGWNLSRNLASKTTSTCSATYSSS